jgi:hypothetical protein
MKVDTYELHKGKLVPVITIEAPIIVDNIMVEPDNLFYDIVKRYESRRQEIKRC